MSTEHHHEPAHDQGSSDHAGQHGAHHRGDHQNGGRHGAHQHGGASWRVAASATLHCLTGCAIGEVLGMVIGTALGWGTIATIALAVGLAFLFGYALTMWGVLKAGVRFKQAVKIALAADTVSITVMEIIDNGVMVVVPGAMDAGLASALFWGALAFAFLVAFLVTWPVNKWLIGRGTGHAVVHAYHH
ncbi:DUF4396 domain-containing protein [Actinokineospora sp. UTMC 2448]|uniref:DUF4396 domain-containing protein n=1 Tax=Actinokineospora sp. UTMC 2448 TaxID=2268449 RepID=UPI002164B9AF|nr:DUF4396 domain-containing protein [Actinokineospora sp. UTMC 2448]UVS80375.1 hypothetical protein Actkin_04126 [Actinokineospora sp. UTMC 2448]